jgi:NADH-quinone oxidoreductase subunit F
VDLVPIQAAPSADERAAIDAVIDPAAGEPVGLRAIEARRHLLLPALHAVQGRVGWVSPGALGEIARRLGVPPAEAYGTASFYALFALRERPPRVVHVCTDLACKARGADALAEELRRDLGAPGEARGGATWLESPCLGLCEQAPAALVTSAGARPQDRAIGHASAARVRAAHDGALLDGAPRTSLPQAGGPELRLLRRVGVVDPTSLDDYRAHGGYAALRRAIDLGPARVVREITESRLVGRGGAAFPTGRKWDAVAKQPARPHYVVCNADESEPGTFKDRVLMEEDPFSVIEAMTIAGLATASEKGFLYVRGEYPLAAARLAAAIDAARSRGLLGDDVMGRGLRFDVEIRRGAGAYICGEETALMASIEGFRGEPRTKPPFPVEAGLFGQPTCVNNVETLVAALDVLTIGAAAFAAIGTPGSTGTKLFCVSGNVARPGLYELPFGARLDALIERAGGVPDGRRVRAVLLGGAAGGFLRPDELATPLTFEDARRAGASIGSGVVLVLDDAQPLADHLARIAAFFRDESCGQCVPCRVGTVRQEELVARLVRRRPLGSEADERALLGELGQAMRDASICGLGQTASSALESAVAKFGLLGGRS